MFHNRGDLYGDLEEALRDHFGDVWIERVEMCAVFKAYGGIEHHLQQQKNPIAMMLAKIHNLIIKYTRRYS